MQVKTSDTHPLVVDWLPVAGPGRLGLTMAPGRRQHTKDGTTRWERDVHADLQRLRDLGATDLVCLLPESELRRIGVSALSVAASVHGLTFSHAPIRDGGAIPENAELRTVVAHVVGAVGSGRSVIVHCAGGLGRSGLVAGCALRALGWSGADALAALVEARGPRCPEREGQRAAIRGFASDPVGSGPG